MAEWPSMFPIVGPILLATVGVVCGGRSESVRVTITPEMRTQAGRQMSSAECQGTRARPTDVDDGRRRCVERPLTSERCVAVGNTSRASSGSGLDGSPGSELSVAGMADLDERGFHSMPEA